MKKNKKIKTLGGNVMKKIFLLVVGVVLFATITTTSLFAEGSKEKEQGKYISLVSKGFQHEFWQTVRLGAEQAANELGVKMTFVGPPTEADIDIQVNMVEDAITQKADGIALAALDVQALTPLAKKIKSAGIALTTFDSDVSPGVSSSFIATDNRAAAAVGADQLAKIIGGKGKILVLVHDPSSSTGIDRRDGFIETIKKNYPDIIVLDPVYGGGDHQKSADLIIDAVRANPDLVGIFASNEGGAVGAGLALKELDKKIPLVGFDSSDQEITFLKEGYISGFVVQNPFQMGYKSVYALNDLIDGKEIDARIDTGATYVDNSNINDPEIQKLLYPLGKK